MDQSPIFSNFPEPDYETSPEPSTEHNRTTLVHRLPPALPAAEREPELSQRRLLLHFLLLGLTILTTTGIGVVWLGDLSSHSLPRGLANGLVYSFTIITILAAHEMGHYIACRYYGVRATLPFFIPVPFPPVGTFGAFIKIKSPFPTRRALFDIGIAGPLAGFVFALPAAFVAHYFAVAYTAPAGESGGGLLIHSPLLFQFFERIFHLPPLIESNPVWWAAWVGVFMTSLNLVPVGQLDGGHVTFAIFGPRGHRAVALTCYLSVIGLAIYSGFYQHVYTWVLYVVILTLMVRVGHPPVIDQDEPLGLGRKLVAIIGLLVFILSFIPVPFSFD